jgi:hypothetical protein
MKAVECIAPPIIIEKPTDMIGRLHAFQKAITEHDANWDRNECKKNKHRSRYKVFVNPQIAIMIVDFKEFISKDTEHYKPEPGEIGSIFKLRFFPKENQKQNYATCLIQHYLDDKLTCTVGLLDFRITMNDEPF